MNNNTESTKLVPYFTKDDVVTFCLDSVNIQAYNLAWYDSHQFEAKVNLPVSFEEYNAYILSLFHYRTKQINGLPFKYFSFSEMYMPSFIEACLSYISNSVDLRVGLRSEWQIMEYDALELQQMHRISNVLAMLGKHDNDLVKGFPKLSNTGVNNFYIVEDNIITSVSEMDPRYTGICAVISQSLSEADQSYSILFRIKLVDQVYAISGVLNAV